MTGPTTQAGKALLDRFSIDAMEYEEKAEFAGVILAIEQEARAQGVTDWRSDEDKRWRRLNARASADAQIAVLRRFVYHKAFCKTQLNDRNNTVGPCDCGLAEVLSNLPASAQTHDEQVAAEAVAKWREAAEKSDEMHRGCDCYGHRTARFLLNKASE